MYCVCVRETLNARQDGKVVMRGKAAPRLTSACVWQLSNDNHYSHLRSVNRQRAAESLNGCLAVTFKDGNVVLLKLFVDMARMAIQRLIVVPV